MGAFEVLKCYKDLLGQIGNLSADFDKDERDLEEELRELEERNKQSMRAYKKTYEQANEANSQLLKVVDTFSVHKDGNQEA